MSPTSIGPEWRGDKATLLITIHATPELVQWAGPLSGLDVLDIGTGCGVAAVAAARAGGRVTAIDCCEDKIYLTKEQAHWAGSDIHVERADAQALPFPDRSFDVVLSQFAHIFAQNPWACVEEAARVLRPEGKFVFSAWTPSSIPGQVMEALGARSIANDASAVPSRWGDAEYVKRGLATLFGRIETATRVFEVRMMSSRQYLEFVRSNMRVAGNPDPWFGHGGELTPLARDILRIADRDRDDVGPRLLHEFQLVRGTRRTG